MRSKSLVLICSLHSLCFDQIWLIFLGHFFVYNVLGTIIGNMH